MNTSVLPTYLGLALWVLLLDLSLFRAKSSHSIKWHITSNYFIFGLFLISFTFQRYQSNFLNRKNNSLEHGSSIWELYYLRRGKTRRTQPQKINHFPFLQRVHPKTGSREYDWITPLVNMQWSQFLYYLVLEHLPTQSWHDLYNILFPVVLHLVNCFYQSLLIYTVDFIDPRKY